MICIHGVELDWACPDCAEESATRGEIPTWRQIRVDDPSADYGELWAAVHDYLVCQGRTDEQAGADLSRAYTRLVEAHNMIHSRYVHERPLEIAGS